MKKPILIFLIATIAVASLFALLKLFWFFQEKRVMNVFILDKTVTSIDRNEHKSLVWILNNQRFVQPNQKSYCHKRDYFGFFPIDKEYEIFDLKSVRINEVDSYAAAYDVAYLADCYGVHSYEWYKGKSKNIRSQKVYGGLNQNDYLLMRRMIENNKLVIAEYNMFSYPTNALVRSKTEELLGISWSGWAGKYFSTLCVESNDGPPSWMKNLYESQHKGAWTSNNPGIILLSNDGQIEILTEGVHLKSGIPIIETANDSKTRFGVSQNVPYVNWFELIDAGKNTVHSNFVLDVTESGLSILSNIGSTNVIPAVIEGQNFFYFCGDFAENPSRMWTAKIAKGNSINHLIYRLSKPNEVNFFTNYYNPIISSILNDYHKQLNP
jgi:hypothetical protein